MNTYKQILCQMSDATLATEHSDRMASIRKSAPGSICVFMEKLYARDAWQEIVKRAGALS